MIIKTNLLLFLCLMAGNQVVQAGNYVDIVEANNKFALKVFKTILEDSAGENIFISPASIASALSMTYIGADDQTRDAMEDVLEYGGLGNKRVNRGNKFLQNSLNKSGEGVDLLFANSLWYDHNYNLKKKFRKYIRKYYDAYIEALDFSASGSADIVNNWVKQKTEDKIESIIDRTDVMDVLYLINAVYFKGNWTHKFDLNWTREDEFYLADGEKKTVMMMRHNKTELPYYKGSGFESIALPYGDERFAMYIFLPDSNSDLNEFYNQLNYNDLMKWIEGLEIREGNLSLPRFTFESDYDLKASLKRLGMDIAFDPQGADFGKMVKSSYGRNIFISRIKHKTFIEVNEEGTEAAAVTGVIMGATAYHPPDFDMVVDRPFFFIIFDSQTKSLLFMGEVENPK